MEFMPLLWDSPEQQPRALHHEDRLLHELDQHNRIYVVDDNNKKEGDLSNARILVTDKKAQNYDCTDVAGIQSSYCVIAFKNEQESGIIGTPQTVYLRDDFCSCHNCRGASLPEHFKNCRYRIYIQKHIYIYIFIYKRIDICACI
jgi:hypothetical protein